MYRRLLYNDDCIKKIDSNTVIFNFNNEWSEYQKWKSENPSEDIQDLNNRNNKLRWNGGRPHTVGNLNIFYNEDGLLLKKESPFEIEYYSNNKIYKTEYLENNKVVLEKNYSAYTEILYKETNYKLNTIKEFDINSGLITYYKKSKGEIEYSVYYREGIFYKTILKKSNKLIKLVELYPHSKIIKKKTIYLFNSLYEYFDYYQTGNIRGHGTLNSNNKSEGSWEFYHHNGNLESTHIFSNGKLIRTSKLFYENGNLYKEIKYD